MSDHDPRDAENAPLLGTALTIWQEVVYRGEHLQVTRAGKPVAVIMPFEEWQGWLRIAGVHNER